MEVKDKKESFSIIESFSPIKFTNISENKDTHFKIEINKDSNSVTQLTENTFNTINTISLSETTTISINEGMKLNKNNLDSLVSHTFIWKDGGNSVYVAGTFDKNEWKQHHKLKKEKNNEFSVTLVKYIETLLKYF